MIMKKTLSVIISAYNEEENIQAAIRSAVELFGTRVDDYELLVFNDGSKDKTGALADEMAKSNPKVKVTHNAVNRGIAYIAKEGIKKASQNYVTWFPGDNSIDKDSIVPVISAIGQADIIVAYMANVHERPPVRRFFSRTFVCLMNVLFGLRLRYYNGATVYPSELVKKIKVTSNGYDFFAEMLVRSLKSGRSFKEVPFLHKHDPNARSKALSLKNFVNVAKTISVLVKDIYILKNPNG